MRVSELVGKRRIDLNVDIGEGFPHDEALLQFATSANVCCGAHAGSPELTRQTVELCLARGVRIGAHPGYPDRKGMGRRSIQPGQEREFLQSLFVQTSEFAKLTTPAYVKPHGAFYNDTAIVLPSGWDFPKDFRSGQSRYEAGGVYLSQTPGVQSLGMILRIQKLPLMGLDNTAHRIVAERAGQKFIREGFADRRYTEDGRLAPRSEPGSVLESPQEIREQVLRLAPFVDSICLHGDTPNCLEFAELVYRTLVDNGYEVGV